HLTPPAEPGTPNRTVVAAREQTKGKGRLGRVWQTKKDDGIAFSLLLRPNLAPSEISAITPLAGLAVCKAIRDYTGLDCKIKWPNDIIIGRKKLVGILTEMSAEFDAVNYVITGIGINVEHTVFPDDIAYKATSLLLETGRHIDKNRFLACVLEHIEDELVRNDLELTSNAVDEYTQLCATVGRNVTFRRGTRTVNGIAVGIAADGELKVMLSDGSIVTVNSGEVTVQGIY
ncbi:MAG: biotin--[acetyl-CoA-carboxylase] ligase, partial [Clostridiales bacterium]|nr:biotin--[acetyl-CoA-carboxylase] ligase [Clostridiales bacterium]